MTHQDEDRAVIFVWICKCGERMRFWAEPDSTPEFPRYRVQHGPNPEMVSPILEGPERSHEWREQVHAYLEGRR